MVFIICFMTIKQKLCTGSLQQSKGLGTASDDLTISGRYPSAFFESGNGIFTFESAQSYTEHYTSTSASGSLPLQDTLPVGGVDFAVAKDPASGTYWLCYY